MYDGDPMLGTCHLCRLEGIELQESHLLPRWVYKRAAVGDLPDTSLVHVSKDDAFRTPRQIKAHLLCSRCEQRFGVHENYVSGLSWQPDGSFPITASVQSIVGSPAEALLADASSLNVASLSYFAASVIWRAEEMRVHDLVKPLEKVHLGPYRESLRRYLNDEQSFPPTARVHLYVYNPQTPLFALLKQAACTPVTTQMGGFHAHMFMLCGLEFRLFIGRRLPARSEAWCLSHATRKVISILPMEKSGLARDFLTAAREATPRGKLAAIRKG